MNAVEHGEGKDVVVTAAIDSDAVAVAVRDYGVGLRSGEEQLVFDRFWRADPARARTSAAPGSGWPSHWRTPGARRLAAGMGGTRARVRCPAYAAQAGRAQVRGFPLPLGPDEAEIAASLARADQYPSTESSGAGSRG